MTFTAGRVSLRVSVVGLLVIGLLLASLWIAGRALLHLVVPGLRQHTIGSELPVWSPFAVGQDAVIVTNDSNVAWICTIEIGWGDNGLSQMTVEPHQVRPVPYAEFKSNKPDLAARRKMASERAELTCRDPFGNEQRWYRPR